MKIHDLRNATFVIESGDHYILIDPMLSGQGHLPAFARFRHKPRPNLMVEILKFGRKAPGKVIANHLEALNHCPTRRAQLKQALADQGLGAKVYVPEDSETLEIVT